MFILKLFKSMKTYKTKVLELLNVTLRICRAFHVM